MRVILHNVENDIYYLYSVVRSPIEIQVGRQLLQLLTTQKHIQRWSTCCVVMITFKFVVGDYCDHKFSDKTGEIKSTGKQLRQIKCACVYVG